MALEEDPAERDSGHVPLSDEAFSAELQGSLAHLRAFARSLCRSPTYADDLVQETMLKAWAARDRFRAGTNFKAWTFTILRRIFISGVRRDKFEKGPESSDPDLRTVRASQQGHMELLEVRAALEFVAPARREALMLVGGAGLSYEEAAVICGCEVGTIKSRVHRARAELMHILEFGPPEIPAVPVKPARKRARA